MIAGIRQARGLVRVDSLVGEVMHDCVGCVERDRTIAALRQENALLRQELAALYDIAALRQECNVTAVTRNESVTDERNVTRNVTDENVTRNVTDENVTRNANVTDTVTRNAECNVTPVTRALAESLVNSKMAAAVRVVAKANADRQRAYRERKRKGKSE